MSKKLYPETDIQNIANAIRNLNGSSDTYTVSEMASAIALPENAYYLKESASANPLSITDGEELKCQSALVTFAPKQSGTGDPSPSNIRPISGWGSLNLAQSGSKNILDITDIHLGVNYNGSMQNNRSCMTLKVPYGTYTASISSIGALDTIAIGRSKTAYPITSSTDYATSQLTNSTKKRTFTINEEYPYVYITMITTNSITLNDCQSCDFMLEVGTTAHEYKPYNSYAMYTATFPDTVYGGSYDFVSGKGTLTEGNVIFDGSMDEGWSLQSINSYGIANFAIVGDNIRQNINESLCNIFIQQNSVISQTTDEGFLVAGFNTLYLRIKSTTTSTVAELRTWLSNNNVQIVYPFITPIEISITPTDVNLLKGSNTVWTDGDTVQIKYFSKSNAVPLLNMLSMGTMNISNINNENNENEVEEIPVEESLEEIENIDNSENE